MTDRNMINKGRTSYAVIGKNIVKYNANKTILDDLNINIEKRSIYAVLGENQAGKSVLLKCLIGILILDGGEVKIMTDTSSYNNRNGEFSGGTETVAVRPNIGFAPQDFNLPAPMQISQWLNFISAVNELSKDQIIERYKAMATTITGLPKFDHTIGRLGYSQKKVLSLVLAIILEPELIVLDDITSGIDTTTLKNIWTLLSHINKSRGCTIILAASNNFCFMNGVVTHIGILMNGRIVKENTARNLMENYEVSNFEDLLIEIILSEDDQRDHSARTSKLPNIKTLITHNDTSSLNIFNTQIVASEKRESVSLAIIQVLILKNIWILAGISSKLLFIILTFAVFLPLAMRTAFAAYSEQRVRIFIDNHEARHCDKNQSYETISCMFVERNLAKSFNVMYIPTENVNAIMNSEFECLLRFYKNYTSSLRRWIERKVENYVDFENSQIIIKMDVIDGRKSAYIKNKLFGYYQEFLSYYAHNMFPEYIPDINYDFIKFNYTSTHDDLYPIYGQFVNSGLIVFLAFFFHTSIAVHLLQQQTADDNCCRDKWKSHLSRLAVQIPIAIVWNAFIVAYSYVLYDIRAYYGYVFICLLLESVCGIHFGYIVCLFVKKYFNVNVILYLKLTICIYMSGFWWQTDELFNWKYSIMNYLPISAGVCFIRNLIEKQYFVVKSIIIVLCWSVVITAITVIDVISTKN